MAGTTGPTKEDARIFLKRLQRLMTERTREDWTSVRVVVREMEEKHGIPEKRCLFLLGKWSAKDWYDYGVCLDLGWLTPAGMAVEVEGVTAHLIPKGPTTNAPGLCFCENCGDDMFFYWEDPCLLSDDGKHSFLQNPETGEAN
ncbi:hypothetical protein [Solidesulfovibrio sp.]